MFLGREKELHKLDSLYHSNKFEMAVFYGRIHVGKTTLLSHFVKDKPCIFMSSLESSKEQNLMVLSQALNELQDTSSQHMSIYKEFSEAFYRIHGLAQRERIVFVIDEYPYLAASDPSISSIIQNMIDHHWKQSQLFLILCGSSMSFMEHQVLGYQSPLYGRRTAQFKIEPFDYRDVSNWFPTYSHLELSLVYGVVGGIPSYLEQWSPDRSVDENILISILDQNAYLYEEPSNLLKQELRDPSSYNAIISAIASGKSKLNEIATTVHIPTSNCTKYLNNLIELGVLRKVTPVLQQNKKKTIYQIQDNLFQFWHRFIPKNMGSIMRGRIEQTYDTHIKAYLNEYMGKIFEEMCFTYLLKYAPLPFELGEFGTWWGNDPKRRKEVEIDLLFTSYDQTEAIFGECKYRNEVTGMEVYESLLEKAELFPHIKKKYYYIFSKSGFSERLKKIQSDTIKLIHIDELYD